MMVIGLGLEFECPECGARPIANALEVARLAGEAMLRTTEHEGVVPILIDPWGGATVGS
jgi:hypothetical protein